MAVSVRMNPELAKELELAAYDNTLRLQHRAALIAKLRAKHGLGTD